MPRKSNVYEIKRPEVSTLEGSRPPEAAGGGIAVQPDGKLVVTGDARYYAHPDCPTMQYAWRPVILRYRMNGALDDIFGDGGVAHPAACSRARANEVRGIAIQPRNRKIIAQAARSIVRLLP